MKRFYIVIVLLGMVMSAVLTGCGQGTTEPPKPADTNPPPAAPAAPAAPSTN